MQTNSNGFFENPPSLQILGIRRAIRKKVMAEHQLELKQAAGWRRYLVKWKINFITNIRYRGILFMGAATLPPDEPANE